MRSQFGTHSRQWEYFILLDHDLEQASRYVEFSEDNMNAYSVEFAHVLASASAEAEVMMKQLCRFFEPDNNPSNIVEYRQILLGSDSHGDIKRLNDFWRVVVGLPRFGLRVQPWKGWHTIGKKLTWWDAHNAVKHQRDEQFWQASLRNALDAVAALYLLVLEHESWVKDPKTNKPNSVEKRTRGGLGTISREMVPPSRLFYLEFSCYLPDGPENNQ